MSATSPSVDLVVLDVNETLFSLHPLAARMAEVGLDDRFELWFARVLRDGFAAAAAGGFAGFRDLAGHHLLELLRRHGATANDDVVTYVLGGFDEVVAHPDVAAGLATLRDAGVSAIALTNGSGALARGLFERSGLIDLVAEIHDVGEVMRWKPAPEPYRFVLDRHGVTPTTAAMVAVHPWDLFGAGSAGLVTGWLDRDGDRAYPEAFGRPDVEASTLSELADRLLERPRW